MGTESERVFVTIGRLVAIAEDGGTCPGSDEGRPGAEGPGQTVAVTLTTVVDVKCSVALATAQLITLAAHSVMVYVDVV